MRLLGFKRIDFNIDFEVREQERSEHFLTILGNKSNTELEGSFKPSRIKHSG